MEALAVSDPRSFPLPLFPYPAIRSLHSPFCTEVGAMAAVGSDVTELKLHSCIGFTGESIFARSDN